jgi:hypothetical protein
VKKSGKAAKRESENGNNQGAGNWNTFAGLFPFPVSAFRFSLLAKTSLNIRGLLSK